MIRRSSLACLLALAVAGAEPISAYAVELIVSPAVGTRDEIAIDGRLLSHRPESEHALWGNIGSLAAWTRAGATITATYAGATASGVTNDDGDFSIVLKPTEIQRFAAGRGTLVVHARDVTVKAPVHVADDNPDFILISDFDDTVAISNIVEPGGVAKTALLLDGKTHPPVPLMSVFYRCLLDRPVRPPLLFVSGSPIQFAPRLVDFLSTNGFPFAGLYLRRLSPTTMKNYKQPVIRRLLERFKGPAIFVGDSGERDPEVYAEIRKEAGSRVLRTYIRDAGNTTDRARFDDVLLFKDPLDAIKDARDRRLFARPCL